MDEPALLSVAIWPKADADRARLTEGLRKLMTEDSAFRFEGGPLPGEVVIAVPGELQCEIVLDRLKRESNIEASVGPPQVALKETFTRPADGEMKYAKQTDGRGEYAHAKIHLYPAESGSGYVFENRVLGGAIPSEFIQSVDDGIKDALKHGVLAGYPVEDVRIELYDGSYHDADSSAAAFKIAGAMAFRDAAKKAAPVLLEPVMRVDVIIPQEYASDVIANLSDRRGHIRFREQRGSMQSISAHVPLSEMFGYSSDLRERSRGQGTFVMRFDRYLPAQKGDYGGPQDAVVRAPQRPSPTARSSGVALPEPEDCDD